MQIIQCLHVQPGDAPLDARFSDRRIPVVEFPDGMGMHLTDLGYDERVAWLRESAANLLALAVTLETVAAATSTPE